MKFVTAFISVSSSATIRLPIFVHPVERCAGLCGLQSIVFNYYAFARLVLISCLRMPFSNRNRDAENWTGMCLQEQSALLKSWNQTLIN